ncbi:MAG: hypothetical protein HC799_06355 [Limnothrix sp. RL_2_0]|nr:hypothetical protein [Limnothrix sp. RL_2_0]
MKGDRPLDQLIELFPEDQVLKDLRAQIDENLARQSGSTPVPETGAENTSPTTAPSAEPAITPLEPPATTDAPEAP